MSRKENRRLLEETADFSGLSGKRAVVGLSGGADSIALVHFLQQRQIPLLAAHLNHGLRGEESRRDEQFVRAFCRERGIELRVRQADVAALAKERGMGLEECGRQERYAFFRELLEEWGGATGVIVTAHTLSDNLETILFRIARGTSLDGLCGIPSGKEGIFRPFLGCTRRAVEEYCARNGLSYVTDSTNADPSYARNRIRAQAVPALQAVNSAAEENAARMLRSLQADWEILAEMTEQLYRKAWEERGLRLSILQKEHPGMIARVTARFLREQGIEPDHAVLETAAEAVRLGKGSVNLPGGARLRAVTGFLRLEEPVSGGENFSFELPEADEAAPFSAILTLPDETKVLFQVENAEEMDSVKKIYRNDLIFCIDYDTIIGKRLFRTRLPGDRIALPGREGSRLLKKLYSEMGLTLRQRRNAWIFSDAEGILWAEYAGISRRAADRPPAKRFLLAIRVESKEGVRQDD